MAVIWNAANPYAAVVFNETQQAARLLDGIKRICAGAALLIALIALVVERSSR